MIPRVSAPESFRFFLPSPTDFSTATPTPPGHGFTNGPGERASCGRSQLGSGWHPAATNQSGLIRCYRSSRFGCQDFLSPSPSDAKTYQTPFIFIHIHLHNPSALITNVINNTFHLNMHTAQYEKCHALLHRNSHQHYGVAQVPCRVHYCDSEFRALHVLKPARFIQKVGNSVYYAWSSSPFKLALLPKILHLKETLVFWPLRN